MCELTSQSTKDSEVRDHAGDERRQQRHVLLGNRDVEHGAPDGRIGQPLGRPSGVKTSKRLPGTS